MNFAIYLVGYLLISIGVLYGLSRFEVVPDWAVVATGFVLAGLGLIGALSRSKGGDVADATTDKVRETPPGGTPPPAPPGTPTY